jgi:hypothetical protein|eukprot:COSAG06_NODE_5352_length_3531_cov_95.618007_2_plen_50_part_00
MTPNNDSEAIYRDHCKTLVGGWRVRITEQRGRAAAHARDLLIRCGHGYY